MRRRDRWREMLGRLRDRFRRDALDAELAEEMEYHRRLLERDRQAIAGATAYRSMGNVTYHREASRDMWSLGLLDDLLQDVRFSLRALRRDRGFTLAVILTLMLGIGANTAVFSIVKAVMLEPLPYARPGQLVSIWTAPTGSPGDRNPAALPQLQDWQQQARVFEGIGGYASNRFDIRRGDVLDQARAVLGTPTLYEVLGARPVLGRLPRPDEERLPVVAISDRLWQRWFNRAPEAVGQQIQMNGQTYTIVGVLPAGFHFPTPDYEMWTTMYPVITSPAPGGANPWLSSRSFHAYKVIGRLKDGVTMQQGERDLNEVQARLAIEYPTSDDGTGVHLQSVRDDAVRSVRTGMWTVFAATGLILLLACVNVAHLLLARTTTRGRELAVRRALGAHRGRITRQLFTESILLGLIGGCAGVLAAYGVTKLMVRFAPPDIPRLENVSMDLASLGFAIGVALLAGLIFGIVPALEGWGHDVHATLRAQGRAGARGDGRVRAALTSLEVAFAVMLLIGAGLMVRSFAALTSADLGVDPDGVSVAQVTLNGDRYASDEAKTLALRNILENVRALPGVTAAGASTSMPPNRIQQAEGFSIEGEPAAAPGKGPSAIFIPTTTGYFEALRIQLLSGRLIDERDAAGSGRVVVISRELARRHFAERDPLGRRLVLGGDSVTIVGVVKDVVYEGLSAPIQSVVYVPFWQRPFPGVWLAIRGTASEATLAKGLREAITSVDPLLAARDPQSLEAFVGESIVRPRFNAWLLGTFGGLALILASIGIYGVVAYGVTQRRGEIGIRLAIGATQTSVVRMVVSSGLRPVIVGLSIGLAASVAGARLLAGLLYGVTPTDATTFAGVAVVLTAAAVVAAWLPARRAAAVDPLLAIRAD